MGLAVCKHCGNTYIGQPNRRNSGTIVRRLTHRRPFCGMRPRSLRVEHVMSQFHDRVLPHISLDQDWGRTLSLRLWDALTQPPTKCSGPGSNALWRTSGSNTCGAMLTTKTINSNGPTWNGVSKP